MSSSKGVLATRPRRPPQADPKAQFIDKGVAPQEQHVPEAPVAEAEGTKRKSEGRDERVVVYLTKDEIKRIRKYAFENDVKLTNLFRDTVMALVEASESESK
jgi:hypothetical protein